MNIKMNETLMEALGIEIKEIGDGKIIGTMPVDERTRQPFGLLHGGASVALAETVASIGACSMVDLDKEICVGLEINANHIKGKKDGYVTAIGTVLHKGSTTMVWEIKIVDEKEELICVSRCTMAILKKR